MKIRTRLSLYFTLVSSCLLLLVLLSVYYLFARISREDFYHHLQERVGFAAGVYLEADEISASRLEALKEKFIVQLPQEEIHFYDSAYKNAFTKTYRHNWDRTVIDKIRKAGYLQFQDGQRQVAGTWYNDNQGNYVIIVSAVDENGKARKLTLVRIMLTLFLLQLFVQFLAGGWFATKILRPIQQINNQVKSIAASDLHKRLNEGQGNDEISQLAFNFNQLLERIERAFDTHKMFIANASHELKTPLTGIIGEIEVSLDKARSNIEYRETLASILNETERLHIIVENFLQLAYEENRVITDKAVTLRIDDLLWEIQEQYHRENNFRVQVKMDNLPPEENLLQVRGNKTLLMLAISNIIRNALKYSGEENVVLRLTADDRAVKIQIEDKGIGISEHAVKNIFEPFYRAQTAKHVQGSGIGLYIANRIITLCNGRIEVNSKIHAGSTFTIILPSSVLF